MVNVIKYWPGATLFPTINVQLKLSLAIGKLQAGEVTGVPVSEKLDPVPNVPAPEFDNPTTDPAGPEDGTTVTR